MLNETTDPHAHLIEVCQSYDLSRVAIMKGAPHPPSTGVNIITNSAGKRNANVENCIPEPFTRPPCHISPLGLHLMKAAEPSCPWARSEDFAFLCVLKHELNKICLEIALGFPLDFHLGESKNPDTGENSVSHLFTLKMAFSFFFHHRIFSYCNIFSCLEIFYWSTIKIFWQ